MGCPAAALTSRAGWSASRVQLCKKKLSTVVLVQLQKKENNEKQQWQNSRWILSDTMHECMDSILRDTQKGLDDQDRESQRYRYSPLR